MGWFFPNVVKLVLIAFLKHYDFDFYEAIDGQEAYDLAETIQSSLIILDLNLPVLNGFSVSKLIRNNAPISKIPIIAVSAVAMKEEKEKALITCDAYLRKPISKNELLVELMKFLPHKIIKD